MLSVELGQSMDPSSAHSQPILQINRIIMELVQGSFIEFSHMD